MVRFPKNFLLKHLGYRFDNDVRGDKLSVCRLDTWQLASRTHSACTLRSFTDDREIVTEIFGLVVNLDPVARAKSFSKKVPSLPFGGNGVPQQSSSGVSNKPSPPGGPWRR